MKRIKITVPVGKDELLSVLADADGVNRGVAFDEAKGKPRLHIKESNGRLRIKCELIGGAARDNGFLEGTMLLGRIKESDGETTLSGLILTAPIYHSLLLAFFVYYIYRCISLGGFNPVPIVLLLFSIFLFKTEFSKQGMIERFIKRAARIVSSKN